MFGDKKEKELKEAFEKVKLDIFNLGNELSSIKMDIFDIKEQLKQLGSSLHINTYTQTEPTDNPTHNLQKPSISDTPTDNPTVPLELRGLKDQNLDSSIRNRGVPTDRQTNQQTDQHMPFSVDNSPITSQINLQKHTNFKEVESEYVVPKSLNTKIVEAKEILDSLDKIKKEIRIKFKQMTQQEMLVFSTLYRLEERFTEGVEYRQIALKLGLSESSIRDYIQKLIAKGIPVDKYKLNNKKILLKISSELKNLASLETILKLREL